MLSRRELTTVLLFGLLGGLVAGVLINAWWWLVSTGLEGVEDNFLENTGVRALLYSGSAAVVLTTHALYVGSYLRRHGVILATMVLTLVAYFPTDLLLTSIRYPDYSPEFFDSLRDMLFYIGSGMVLVGIFGELIRLLPTKIPASILARSRIGLAVPLGWTLGFAFQTAAGGEPWSVTFGSGDWSVWLFGLSIAGFGLSGLLPAVLSERVLSLDASSAGAQAAYVPTGAPLLPLVRPDVSQHPNLAPGLDGLYEHPKATQVLTFALLGMFVFAPLSVAAWVTGAKAKSEVAQNPGLYRRSSSLQVGYVLGIIGTLLWAAGILIILIVMAWLMSLRS